MLAELTIPRKKSASVERHDPRPQPRREIDFGHGAVRKRLPRRNIRFVRFGKIEAVEAQEGVARHEGRALVAIHERVVLGQPERISRRQGAKVGISVGPKVLWPRQGAFQEPTIPNTGRPTVLGKLLLMQRQDGAFQQPDGLGHGLLRQSREDVPMLAHAAATDFHLSTELGLFRRDRSGLDMLRRLRMRRTGVIPLVIGEPASNALALFHRQHLRLDTANMARPSPNRQP